MSHIKFIDKSTAGLGIVLAVILILTVLSLVLVDYFTSQSTIPVETPETEKEIQKKILEDTLTHMICMRGYWYAERMYRGTRMRSFYGIVPLFDTDGHPMRCPLEKDTL